MDQRPARALFAACVTVLGGGGVARSLIRLLEPYGCAVALVRHDRPIDGARAVGRSSLHDVARDTDLLVVALALTPGTEHLVDATLLDLLPGHCVLVNVAPGRHVDTEALVAALSEGRLGAAALDVTEPEPLPVDHPLWAVDRSLVTPHVSCTEEIAVRSCWRASPRTPAGTAPVEPWSAPSNRARATEATTWSGWACRPRSRGPTVLIWRPSRGRPARGGETVRTLDDLHRLPAVLGDTHITRRVKTTWYRRHEG